MIWLEKIFLAICGRAFYFLPWGGGLEGSVSSGFSLTSGSSESKVVAHTWGRLIPGMVKILPFNLIKTIRGKKNHEIVSWTWVMEQQADLRLHGSLEYLKNKQNVPRNITQFDSGHLFCHEEVNFEVTKAICFLSSCNFHFVQLKNTVFTWTL